MIARRRFVVALGLTIAAASAWALVDGAPEAIPAGVEFDGPALENGQWVMTLRYPGGWLKARIERAQAAEMFPPRDAVDAAAGVDVRKMTRTLRRTLLQAYAERDKAGPQPRLNRGEGFWI